MDLIGEVRAESVASSDRAQPALLKRCKTLTCIALLLTPIDVGPVELSRLLPRPLLLLPEQLSSSGENLAHGKKTRGGANAD
jgi:hypothetical protein